MLSKFLPTGSSRMGKKSIKKGTRGRTITIIIPIKKKLVEKIPESRCSGQRKKRGLNLKLPELKGKGKYLEE